ncbi:transcriptional regulator YeiL [uncultured Vagococcus sp.]|uniref:transcriptional regulator YeiL n=1 Tax=uncultured Vagococcus sp. TaxID=189676 RepID=UPI0028D586DF|nr:transcriptional regulator YeiL [uncultured Vagococcus sp.]
MKKVRLNDGSEYRDLWQPVKSLMGLPIEELAHLEWYRRGERIIRYNQGTDKLFVLLKGKAKIYMIHEDGKQSIIHFMRKGELIGELTLLEVEERTKDVVAQSDCLCLVIPLKENRQVLLEDPVFLKQLNVYLAKKLLARTDRFSEGLNYPLINRLAAFILYTETTGRYQEKHTEVADYLSVSYRHLLYTFKQLRDREIILKEKQGYLIIGRAQLKKLAKDIHA